MKKQTRTYKTSEAQFNKMYSKYLREYETKNATLSKRGLHIKERKYSRIEFEAEYIAIKNESKKGVNVSKKLLREQTYQWSKKQAVAFREGMVAKGIPESELPSLEKLRIGGRDYLEKYIERLQKAHPEWSMSEIGAEVSQTIFGSE